MRTGTLHRLLARLPHFHPQRQGQGVGMADAVRPGAGRLPNAGTVMRHRAGRQPLGLQERQGRQSSLVLAHTGVVEHTQHWSGRRSITG